MIERVNIELLERHLNGLIEAKQVRYEDGEPLNGKELEEAIAEYQNLSIDIEAMGLEEELKAIHKDVLSPTARTISIKVITTVAAAVLIAIACLLIFQDQRKPDFDDYFAHFDQLITFRNNNNESLNLAMVAYDAKNYDQAFQIFNQLKLESLSSEVSFYAGVSALGSSRFQEALDYFKRASKGENKYYQQIQWYSALSLWQLDQLDNSIEQLRKISFDQFNFEKAQSLLVYLESLKATH